MSDQITKLQNSLELLNQDNKTSQNPDTIPSKEISNTRLKNPIKQLSSYLEKAQSHDNHKNSRNPDSSPIVIFIEELNHLFNDESQPSQPKKQDISKEEHSDDAHESVNNRIYDKIKAIRLGSVKPELTINLINDKLASLQKMHKAIEAKKEDISQIVTELKKQLSASFQELRAKLDAKFNELITGADEILKSKTQEFSDLQSNISTKADHVQSIKDILVQNFQSNIKEHDKYDENLAKLQEKKAEIHSFVQDMDSIDVQKVITQCKIRSFLKPNPLSDYIDKIHLIELEIVGLRGVEDVSPPTAKDQKLFEKATQDRNVRAFPSSTNEPRGHHRVSSNDSKQLIGSRILPTSPKETSVIFGEATSRREDNSVEYERFFTVQTQPDSREKLYPSKLLSPQAVASIFEKKSQPVSRDVNSIVSIRARGLQKSSNLTSSLVSDWKTGNKTENPKFDVLNLWGKQPLNNTTKLKETASNNAAGSTNTAGGSVFLDRLRRQKEMFLKTSLNQKR